jgi:phospholipid/cholesterol/gamma-HCH transport system substrate-binding protein
LLADVTPVLSPTGDHVNNLVGAVRVFTDFGFPPVIWNLNRYLDRIQKLLDDNGADLKVLGEAVLPKLKGIAGSLMNFDTGQILSNFLASVPADGTITLHMTIPPK